MIRDRARGLVAAVLCATLFGTSGCSTEGSEPAAKPRAATTPSADPARGTATGPSSPSPEPGVPSPGSMQTPATTSGPLTAASFPVPRRLGPGWRYAVDPGDAEEGYAGNGTPTLARNPQEIVQTAVPFGCPRAVPMPAPAHALEVDYALRGRKVIAIRGSFGDPGAATRFYTARARNLRDCAGRSGSAAIGPLVTAVSTPARAALSSDRTPRSDPWHELCLLDRDTVVLLAAQGARPFTDRATRRLVRLFRS